MNKIKICHFAMVGPVFCSDSNTVHSQPDSPDGFTYLSEMYDIKILLCTSQPKTHFALALAWKRAPVKSKIEAHFPFLVTTYIRTIGFRSCDFQFILD